MSKLKITIFFYSFLSLSKLKWQEEDHAPVKDVLVLVLVPVVEDTLSVPTLVLALTSVVQENQESQESLESLDVTLDVTTKWLSPSKLFINNTHELFSVPYHLSSQPFDSLFYSFHNDRLVCIWIVLIDIIYPLTLLLFNELSTDHTYTCILRLT